MAKTPVYVEQCVGFVNHGDGWKVFFADTPWRNILQGTIKWYQMKIPVPEELLPPDLPGEVTMEKANG